ncbi:hypothetical protein JL722_5516 [Aureococcus anophagefferens]|nr:hypothetical protein JL722_5516 [Aureococcus anophagefferens]
MAARFDARALLLAAWLVNTQALLLAAWLVHTAAALKPITIHARALAATEHRVIRDTCERLGYAADVVAVAGEERAAILVDCDAEDDEPLVFGVMESLDALGGVGARRALARERRRGQLRGRAA